MKARFSLALAVLLTLNSCSLSSDEWRQLAERSGLRDQAKIKLEEQLEELGGKGIFRDIEDLRPVIEALVRVIDDLWGDDEEVSSDKRLVKYSNDYQARAVVDFEAGYLQVETVAEQDALAQLKQAIVLSVLTPQNLSLEDIFSDRSPDLGAEPFLYQQVLDQDAQGIRYNWRAERFADYMIANHLQTRRSNGQVIRSVRTNLVGNHLHLRSLQFANSVLRYSREYGIAPDLVYAVIEVESSFNPYAVSSANALGLMQVVPSTAGRDVFERIKKLPGEPTKQQLFTPDFNIDVGTGYLHILDSLYLNRILHPTTRQYAQISAYNGGAGNVFRAFSSNREQAVARINGMTPEQVYQHLLTTHPFAESRNYLRKVRAAQTKYKG